MPTLFHHLMSLDFGKPPPGGFSANWLKTVYHLHVSKSRAVGKDGVRHQAFEQNLDAECELIARKVNDGSYNLTTYREKLIARGADRKPRQISVPTIRDRLALRGALEYLKSEFPAAHPRPPHIFIKEIKDHLKQLDSSSSFLRMDIKDFYPSLRHEIIRGVLESSTVPKSIVDFVMKAVSTATGKKSLSTVDAGVPQGLSISNALAAIYMARFDEVAGKLTFYKRYVDDIMVICPVSETISMHQILSGSLFEIGLESHPLGVAGKTEISSFDDGAQYLGYEITPSQVSVRQSSLAKMFSNLAKVITCFRYKKNVEKHIFRLNLKISGCIINKSRRGWLMFFSQTDNISQLAYLDSWLIAQIKGTGVESNRIKSFKKAY